MHMRVIIDRFEGDLAVVELNEVMYNVPRALFDGAHEGDVVEITVLGKPDEAADAMHEVFESMRKKSRRKKKHPKKPQSVTPPAAQNVEDNAAPPVPREG